MFNRRLRAFVSAVLCIFLSFALIPQFPSGAASPALRGSGTESDPYLISNTDELYALASSVNAGDPRDGEHFLLTEDIVLNDISDFDEWSDQNRPENIWIPIGDALIEEGFESGHYFAGHFDGGGHSITGAYIRASAGLSGVGLFGTIHDGALIENLSLHSFYIPSNARNCGGIAGLAYDSNIRNCIVSGVVNGNSSCGGIVGSFERGGIADCTASVQVCGVNSAGGIAGSCYSVNMSNCRALGSVTADNYTGGIVGLIGSGIVSDCAGECSVRSIERGGGIAGFSFNSFYTRCASFGSISSDDYAGGIVGLSQAVEIRLCKNDSAIECGRYGGGAVGMCCGTVINSFENRGDISGEYYIGGVAGWSHNGNDFVSIMPQARYYDSGAIITQCANLGRISGEWGIGGIVGDCHETEIFDCCNAGEVVSIEYAGGITGYTADCTISRCYNSGSVFAEYAADALIGRNSMNKTDVSFCYYLDTSCGAPSEHGTAYTHEELMLEQSYEGFDFTAVWFFNENTEYPYAELRFLADPSEILFGDLDASGSVSIADSLIALRGAMNLVELSPYQLLVGDLNSDGGISAADAVMILRIALGTV